MSAVLEEIDRWFERIARTLAWAAAILLLATAALNAIEIIRRLAVGHSFAWMTTLSVFLMVWMVFVGISSAYMTRSDIRLTYFVSKFPLPFRRVIGVILSCIMVLFAAFLIRYAADLIPLQVQRDRITGIPRYMYTVPVVIAAFFIGISALRDLIMLISNKWEVIIKESDEGGIL